MGALRWLRCRADRLLLAKLEVGQVTAEAAALTEPVAGCLFKLYTIPCVHTTICDSCRIVTDVNSVAASRVVALEGATQANGPSVAIRQPAPDMYIDANPIAPTMRLRARTPFALLLALGDALLHTAKLNLRADGVHRFSFRVRCGGRGLAFLAPPQTAQSLLDRLPKPQSPPDFVQQDLQERVRWILTPPINELLSDPQLCLPHAPYRYQLLGIKWLHDRDGGLLADEMGLGKTMQAILAARLLWREHEIERVLVICPKVLIPTWLAELRKWWPDVLHNTKVIEGDPQRWLSSMSSGIAFKLINYEKLALHREWLAGQGFAHDLVIIDEAQRIKNAESKTAMAVKALHARRRWALTGTPLENRVEDLVSIMDFVRPRRGFLTCEQRMLLSILGTLLEDTIRGRVKPHMLRRHTNEVLKDLPPMLVEDVELELGERQRQAYERAECEGVVELNARGDTVTVTHVFALIMRLKQLCNFDAVSGESVKIDGLREDLDELVQSGRKALVFSGFTDERFGVKRIAASLPPDCSPIAFHGGLGDRVRRAVIKSFNEDPAVRVMVLNYRVGGLGLNLHAANYVYLFDRWWNPAVEDQAIKRAHRIGQQDRVIVRRFVCRDTVEERIVAKLAEKRRLFARVNDEAGLSSEAMGFTEEELFSLFRELKVRPKRGRPSGGRA